MLYCFEYLELAAVVHALGTLHDVLVRQLLEGLVSRVAQDLPQGDGERPDRARAAVAIL